MVALVEEKPQKQEDELGALNVRSIPKVLRRNFKMWCLRRDLSMEEAAIELIEMAVLGEVDLPGSKS